MSENDFDHNSHEMAQNPWPRWEQLRAGPPLAHSDQHGGFHIASRYQEVCDIVRNTAVFSSSMRMIPPIKSPSKPPIDYDPPEHRLYRVIINPFFTPAKVKEAEPWIREMVAQCVRPLLASDGFNVPRDIGGPLMRGVTLRIMGIADAPADVNTWVDDLIFSRNKPEEAAKKLVAFLAGEMAQRRAQPANDLMTALTQSRYGDRPLEPSEQINMALLVLMAGLDTTNFAISGSVWYLMLHPAARKDLANADETTWGLAMDEFVRWTTPAPNVGRVARMDTEVGGCPMRQGEKVLMLYGSANRDEKEFANANDVVLDRFPNRHLGFGMGPHRCVGSHLAKLVMQIVLGELLKGLDNFELADPGAVVWESAAVRGIRNLPLVRK